MSKPPKFISLITTYRCNYKCHMCNIWQYPSKTSGEITAAHLAKLPATGAVNVTGGEAFLRDDLSDILTVLHEKADRVVISTNGYLTERIVKIAKQHPWIGVRISVEGLPAVNDELRGVKAGFEHALRTLTELSNIGLKDIGFGITLSDRNAESLIPLYHLSKMMKLEFATAAVHNSFYFHKFDNKIQRPDALIGALDELIRELLHSSRPKDWFRAYFNHGLIEYVSGRPRLLACSMGEDACFIDPYGEVLPCNGMETPISFGNLTRQSWDEIWNGPHAETVRCGTRNCGKNCWMIGNASEPIKRNKLGVIRWIAGRRLSGASAMPRPESPHGEKVGAPCSSEKAPSSNFPIWN
jgi:MoaA/NifB/PqqE/SkfB family radical SAM enzyme